MALGALALVLAGPLATAPGVAAAEPAARAATFIDLGSASTYSVLAGAGVTNTGTATVLSGDLGLSPGGTVGGFPPGTYQGTLHDKDTAAGVAQEDRQAAYDDALAQTSTTTFGGDQAGAIFKPGVHTSAAAMTNSGTVTLDADGDSSAVFVFQVGGALSTAAATKIVLIDGALANNVYWQVNGAVSAGAGAKLVGTFLATGAFSFGEGSSLKGRALTPSTVALANTPVTEPVDDFTAPLVTISGGDTRSTNDTTPSISGTTDEPTGSPVIVTVDDQTLATTAGAGGGWSVSASALAEGPHDVVASVTDASRNTGTATQTLTVDVAAPAVTIDGGGTHATNDTTPAITGTSSAPADTLVTVTVEEQTLTAPVGSGGAWSVDAATLTEAPHSVVASVDDAAGNTGTASQILTVDVTVPVVTIDGGARRATDDREPFIRGTTAEQAGTQVDVTVEGQELVAIVEPGGAWKVSATLLAPGPHTVVASITDAAQNTGTASQVLTVKEPGQTDRFRPDAAIRAINGSFVGDRVYDASKQRVTKQLSRGTRSVTFQVRVTNRGNTTDRMELRGTPRSKAFKVTYKAGGQNVTGAVTAGTYRTAALAPGKASSLIVKVIRTKAARYGDRRTFDVHASSSSDASEGDTVAGIVRIVR